MLLGPDQHRLHLYLPVFFFGLFLLQIVLFEDERIVLDVLLLFKNVGKHIESLLWCWTWALASFCHVALNWGSA